MNRQLRWLLLLPVAVALVAVASASRLQLFWWPEELHDATTGTQGEPLEVVDTWTDADGDEHDRRLELTVVDVVPATTVPTFSDPATVTPVPGTAVWEVQLELHLDGDVPLGGCHVSILDEEGRETTAAGGTVGDVSLPFPACEPEGKTGPLYDGTRIEGNEERPERYVVKVYVITDEDAVPSKVRVWWEPPDYAEVTLSD